MEHRIEKMGISSLERLKEVLIEVWETLTPGTINSLFAEMPRRMRQVRQNLGHHPTSHRGLMIACYLLLLNA
jgi:hypothetical protein